ncbi:hypothetical protein THIOM_001822 [Candidatus Thiomargarita nelsonii]|uniref:Zinc ribbon domain-containing protein n=1 Tax=Candidatus Thiomargarita nelsonii TaxID=1003181 RepID=A0A0A6NZI9_9GAMM|nr:hypothetical protein THIOM_001822 [Candidatus Thiomargarita nelsonii]
MERCPVCKARLKADTDICPRCSTELSMLLSIENQAKNFFYQAIDRFESGDLSGATRVVEQSLELKREPLTLALQGFIASFKSVNH